MRDTIYCSEDRDKRYKPEKYHIYNLNELGQTGKQQTERVKKSEPVGFEPARTHLYLAILAAVNCVSHRLTPC